MKPHPFHRLHALRMENDEAGYEMRETAPRMQAIAARLDKGETVKPLSAWQLFQTPPELAAHLVGLLQITPESWVLEPSAGLGRLLDPIEAAGPAEIVAVEPAPDLAAVLYKREGIKFYQRDFLTLTPKEAGLFDCIAMNPPFHMRADIQHILHAVGFLRPGGTLAALCMDTAHREKTLRPLATTWEPIPAGTFRSAGTNVATVLLTISRPA